MQPLHVKNGEGERFVVPNAIELTILSPGATTNGACAVYEHVVELVIGPPRHIHNSQDELFEIIDGEFKIEIAGQLYTHQLGDFAFMPRGTIHAFKNIGSSRGRLQYTFNPAGKTEAMFRAFHKAAQEGSLTSERMNEMAAEHGSSDGWSAALSHINAKKEGIQ